MENLCVHGDSFHNNVIALIVPNKPVLRKLAESLNKAQLSNAELCRDKQVIDAVKRSLIDHATKSGLSRVEIPSEIKLCDEEWLPDTGLVTAALKIRRKQIQEYYKADIVAMYGGSPSSKSA